MLQMNPQPMPEADRKAWQEAYDMWRATQELFARENEYDEQEDH